jgi:hypothetical protein
MIKPFFYAPHLDPAVTLHVLKPCGAVVVEHAFVMHVSIVEVSLVQQGLRH